MGSNLKSYDKITKRGEEVAGIGSGGEANLKLIPIRQVVASLAQSFVGAWRTDKRHKVRNTPLLDLVLSLF